MARVLLIRHGQASFGAAQYDCLSPRGEQQAHWLGQCLARDFAGTVPHALWQGDMQRHRQTAAGLLSGYGAALPLYTDAGWNEFDHQAVLRAHEPRYADPAQLAQDLATQEQPREAFTQMFRAALQRWIRGEGDYPESWRAFQQRAQAALQRVLASGEPNDTHWVVTSGGVISVLAQSILECSDDGALRINWTLANAGFSLIQARANGERFLVSLNEQGHFRGAQAHLLSLR